MFRYKKMNELLLEERQKNRVLTSQIADITDAIIELAELSATQDDALVELAEILEENEVIV